MFRCASPGGEGQREHALTAGLDEVGERGRVARRCAEPLTRRDEPVTNQVLSISTTAWSCLDEAEIDGRTTALKRHGTKLSIVESGIKGGIPVHYHPGRDVVGGASARRHPDFAGGRS